MPDPTQKSAINAANPIWDRPRPLPVWHLSYLDRRDRNWACGAGCDFQIEDLDTAAGTYRLVVRSTGAVAPMCLVRTWRSDRNTNAPFRLLTPAAFRDDSAGGDTLALAHRCPAEAAPATSLAGGGS